MTFAESLLFYPPLSFCLPPGLISKEHLFPHFSVRVTHSVLSPTCTPFCSPAVVPFGFPTSPGYVLTPGDLELGASNKKENSVFVFMDLGCLTHSDLFCPDISNMHDFMFLHS